MTKLQAIDLLEGYSAEYKNIGTTDDLQALMDIVYEIEDSVDGLYLYSHIFSDDDSIYEFDDEILWDYLMGERGGDLASVYYFLGSVTPNDAIVRINVYGNLEAVDGEYLDMLARKGIDFIEDADDDLFDGPEELNDEGDE